MRVFLIVFLFIAVILGACSDRVNETIDEGQILLSGSGQYWDAQADIKTKVSVSEREESTIIIPLDSSGEITLKCKEEHDEKIEFEYLLSKFEAKGKETLEADETEISLNFEGGIPYDDETSTYTLTLKWSADGEAKEEMIELVQQ